MTPSYDVPTGHAPPLSGAGGAIRWICTKNPFYVMSAGLFLAGLWISFDTKEIEAEATWALMGWLTGYTLLLAVTAYLLVRYASVWDDVRTVLLLVVLMFLATSVIFDDVLVRSPSLGRACYLMGLGFAMTVSEGLLRGIGLKMPVLFRCPYYLILALFFLYPLALGTLEPRNHSESLMWGLFGFATIAGLLFLTLLPAIRRGADYVRNNGSPWTWPLYPWTLFGLLALAVPARAFLLCWSMHHPEGNTFGQLIIGPYFLVPFGFALVVLLLEGGIISRNSFVCRCALFLPFVLTLLAARGHRQEPLYEEFLSLFAARLGAMPVYLNLGLAGVFYISAWLRGQSVASWGLTAALVGLAIVNPDRPDIHYLLDPKSLPLAAAAVLKLGLGVWRRHSWNCLAGGVLASLGLAYPGAEALSPYRDLIALHLIILTMMLVGAAFNDALGQSLKILAAGFIFSLSVVCLIASFTEQSFLKIPSWAPSVYPLVGAGVLAFYGFVLRHRPSQVIAGVIGLCWLAPAAWKGYRMSRELVVGLDYIVGSLALFALAVVVSLAKAGMFRRQETKVERELPEIAK